MIVNYELGIFLSFLYRLFGLIFIVVRKGRYDRIRSFILGMCFFIDEDDVNLFV